jgi:hypothetical protein
MCAAASVDCCCPECFAAGSGTRYRVLSRASSAGGARAELELLVRTTAAGFYPKLPGARTASPYQRACVAPEVQAVGHSPCQDSTAAGADACQLVDSA